MAEKLVRFGISMEEELLKNFDGIIHQKGYHNRSEAVRDLIRDYLVEIQWREKETKVAGTITLVYDHHQRGLSDCLTDLQHQRHHLVLATTHMHLDEANCLEVLIVRGKVSEIQQLADVLISTKGVKHGKLTMTTTGKGLI